MRQEPDQESHALRQPGEVRTGRADEGLLLDLDATNRLLRIGSLFLQQGNLASVLGEIVDAAIAVSGADFGNLQLLEPSGALRIAAQRGFPDWWLDYWQRVDLGRGSCGTALERRQRVIVEDLEASPIFAGTPGLEVQLRAGVRAVLSTPLLSRAGEPIGMLSTHYRAPGRPGAQVLRLLDLVARQAADILERAQAEEARRRSEARLRALVEASSEVLYTMSPDWSEMRQLHGREFLASTAEPSRAWLQAYIHPDDQPKVMAAINEAIRTKSVFQLEHRVLRADGSLGWTLSRAIPLLGADGEIVEWFGAASDVTARKRAELALERAHAHQVEANRRKDEFLAMLGHELRNPLAAIRNATELLKLIGSDDPQLQPAYGVLERQSEHMSRLLDGLLEVSRIAQGKLQVELAPVDVGEVMETVLQDRSCQIEARGLQLGRDFPAERLWVSGDSVRLAQTFDNLIGNAIKFTEAPGTIEVALAREGARVRICVRDTGVGIRPEMLDRIFDPFQQESQDVARSEGGLGLGLALARQFVELHGGTIEVRSGGRGKGAEFELQLPLASPPAPEPRERPALAAPRCRILVVEDNADAAQMLAGLLAALGHEVRVAESGMEALACLRRQQADVVLCDLGLPGMSGHELARAIRDDPALCGMLLLAVTGYGQPDDRQRTLEAGFDGHLTKPVDFSALQAALSSIDDRRRRPEPAP